MGPFLNPSTVIAMLMMLMNAGVRDLASCIPSDAYWQAKHVTVSLDQLTHELDTLKPEDVSKLVADLDADDPQARDAAGDRIAAIGQAALPTLRAAAKNGPPEIVARANALIGRIGSAAKAHAVRRLIAIRTLGERKEQAALPLLRSLLDSKELFEADYAKAAIANIEGKPFAPATASDADRAADVGLLPARLDMVTQFTPQYDGILSIDKIIDQFPVPNDQKAPMREQANTQIIHTLETIGNVRLDALTWGFYAAPPGVPGNTMVILRGQFDPHTLSTAILGEAAGVRKINGFDVYAFDEDTMLLMPGDGRIIFMAREAGGELGLDQMTAALKTGAGDLSKNADLSGLIKSADTRQPLWMAVKMAPGLREIAEPFGEFDTITLSASPTREEGKIVSQLRLQATASDAVKARQLAANIQGELKQAAGQMRNEPGELAVYKPMVELMESVKINTDDAKTTMTGSLREMPIVPLLSWPPEGVRANGIAPMPVRR